MEPGVSIVRPANMNTVMTRSTASGVVRRVTARGAFTRPRANTATAPAATSASGAAPPPTAPGASTAPPASTRSEKVCMTREKFSALIAGHETGLLECKLTKTEILMRWNGKQIRKIYA